MELATGMGLPPLAENEERLSLILKKCQDCCWGLSMKLMGKVALELGMVFTRFTYAFAFCPEFGGGGHSWDYAFL